jgi:hypothetical protein
LTCDPRIARRKLVRFVSVNADTLATAMARPLMECARHLGFGDALQAGASAAAAPRRCDGRGVRLGRPGGDQCGRRPCWFGGHRRAPARRDVPPPPGTATLCSTLIDAGTAVALASGFGGEHCSPYNMLMAVSFACSLMDLSPAEAICAATGNRACALALGHRSGSLEQGKVADLLLLNVTDYREESEQVVINHVHMVWKNRRAIYQEGEVTGWTAH